jgi:hypothetical protein
MYTVFRATTDNLNFDFLNQIGFEMNNIRAGVYNGLLKTKNGFSCEVSTSDFWPDHTTQIIKFISIFGDIITILKRNKYVVTFDILVEPEDFREERIALFLFHEQEFLAKLLAVGVNYVITVVPGNKAPNKQLIGSPSEKLTTAK